MKTLNDQITALTKRIVRMEEESGWDLVQNLYNRDWKKDVSAAKKQLAELRREQRRQQQEQTIEVLRQRK